MGKMTCENFAVNSEDPEKVGLVYTVCPKVLSNFNTRTTQAIYFTFNLRLFRSN